MLGPACDTTQIPLHWPPEGPGQEGSYPGDVGMWPGSLVGDTVQCHGHF